MRKFDYTKDALNLFQGNSDLFLDVSPMSLVLAPVKITCSEPVGLANARNYDENLIADFLGFDYLFTTIHQLQITSFYDEDGRYCKPLTDQLIYYWSNYLQESFVDPMSLVLNEYRDQKGHLPDTYFEKMLNLELMSELSMREIVAAKNWNEDYAGIVISFIDWPAGQTKLSVFGPMAEAGSILKAIKEQIAGEN